MLSAGDIVLLNFPYTNQAGSKVRHGLVLGLNDRNGHADVNVAYVTSEVDSYIYDPSAIAIDATDLAEGALKHASVARVAKVLTIHSSKCSKVARLSSAKINKALRKTTALHVERLAFNKCVTLKFTPGVTAVPPSGKLLDASELKNMVEASLDGWLTTGRFNAEFEKKLAAFIGIKHPATVNPIPHFGAVPVFVDVDPLTHNIDISKIEAAISSKTKAIRLAHSLGNPPRSPYAVAKLYAYWICVNYREAYGMYACNGILFNHESPRRGETFVTRKITRGLANISQGLEDCLFMGNIDALRDWGHAKDYVRMQWMMLQQDQPDDFVIATGVQYSVRQFIEWTAAELGMPLRWQGQGVSEVGYWNDKAIVKIDPRYFRPTEVETLLGDPTKAKQKLGWVPEITVQDMCKEMVAHDLAQAKQHCLLRSHGIATSISLEARG